MEIHVSSFGWWFFPPSLSFAPPYPAFNPVSTQLFHKPWSHSFPGAARTTNSEPGHFPQAGREGRGGGRRGGTRRAGREGAGGRPGSEARGPPGRRPPGPGQRSGTAEPGRARSAGRRAAGGRKSGGEAPRGQRRREAAGEKGRVSPPLRPLRRFPPPRGGRGRRETGSGHGGLGSGGCGAGRAARARRGLRRGGRQSLVSVTDAAGERDGRSGAGEGIL